MACRKVAPFAERLIAAFRSALSISLQQPLIWKGDAMAIQQLRDFVRDGDVIPVEKDTQTLTEPGRTTRPRIRAVFALKVIRDLSHQYHYVQTVLLEATDK
jgi:hypothetical protein